MSQLELEPEPELLLEQTALPEQQQPQPGRELVTKLE